MFNPTSNVNDCNNKKSIISHFFTSTNCVVCQITCDKNICDLCKENDQESLLILNNKINETERKLMAVRKVCETCCHRRFETDCISIDCPTLYSLNTAKRDQKKANNLRNILQELF